MSKVNIKQLKVQASFICYMNNRQARRDSITALLKWLDDKGNILPLDNRKRLINKIVNLNYAIEQYEI